MESLIENRIKFIMDEIVRFGKGIKLCKEFPAQEAYYKGLYDASQWELNFLINLRDHKIFV